MTLAWRRAYSVGAVDPVEHHGVGRLLDVVEDLVHGRHEVVDVLAVDRRDERLVEALDDVVEDLVADVLVLEDRGADRLGVVVVVHELDQQLRRLVEVGREVREQAEVVAAPSGRG